MPKIVDHAVRRAEVLDSLWRVVRDRGLDGTSIREVAHEAGLSMGAVTYYFADKDDLLVSAHRLAYVSGHAKLPIGGHGTAH